MDKLVFGTDPEFFLTYKDPGVVYDEFVKGKDFVYSPALLEMEKGIKPVTDDIKHPVIIDEDKYRVVMDGVAMELNFKIPFENPFDMFDKVQEAKDKIEKFAKKHGLGFSSSPVINFDYNRWWKDEYTKNEKFFQGIIFGCDPDKDIFDVTWLCKILSQSTHPLRYGGGHIHTSLYGENNPIYKYYAPYIKLLAITAGNYCIANSQFPEEESMRAKYYGKPGKYRDQKYPNGFYGIEYRTPSNGWTNFSREIFGGLIEMFNKAYDYLLNPKVGKKILELYEYETVSAITEANVNLAKTIINKL